ncbi:LacI family DNA-binding transcriptional regulator [Amantichitinum ursilacus]|uniref:HTH-type transcriptional regulator DegA n=1 Tax=Amantichitinum ursilacus TaxID=857265 RepID=A0A0N1JRN4_9NEIS|nr:LacI family DNA-binding transcriptional regulator [Amantichitinum ursilacus]KPC49572.1 HTH-type transcriptional regulator DegA [Amantichitinum ursilacus]
MPRQNVTLEHIAAAAGVSQMTVSRALASKPGVSRDKRDEILRIAAELGYVGHRAEQRSSDRRSQIVGLITAELHNPFIGELVAGVGRAARPAGYELLVYSLVEHDQPPLLSVLKLMQQVTAGIIALLPYEYRYLDALVAARVPVITVDQHGQYSRFPSIAADSYAGACMAMRHLIAQGHRRIAFITGNEHMASAQDRHRGYLDMLAQAGLPQDPALVVPGHYAKAEGYAAAQTLLALPERPTALFAANDMSALGALQAIRDAGLRIPDDVSVVGFDDIPAAEQQHPPLTTVRQPMQQMGRSAVNTLLALIAGLEAASPQIVLPTELVVRGSTAPPRRVTA